MKDFFCLLSIDHEARYTNTQYNSTEVARVKELHKKYRSATSDDAEVFQFVDSILFSFLYRFFLFECFLLVFDFLLRDNQELH